MCTEGQMVMVERIEFKEPVKVSLQGQTVTLSAGDRSETKAFRCKDVDFSVEGNALMLKGHNEKKKTRSVINTVKKHLENIVTGFGRGYEYKMKVVFSHFPMNLQISGNQVIINNFTGEKKPRKSQIVGENTNVEIKGKDITITGPNREHVGQTAANLEKTTKLRGKDLRIFQDGIYLANKGIAEKPGEGAENA